MVVLGLATPHNEEMKQVRGVDQTPYPSQLHGASLATCSDAESLSRNRKKVSGCSVWLHSRRSASSKDSDRVLGLALRHIRKEYQVDHVWNNVEETLKLRQPCKNEKTENNNAGTSDLIRPLIHRKCHSFVGLDRQIGSSPPARSGSFTSIQMLHTHRHTHTRLAGAGSTLKGKRKKKVDTNDGQKAKTAPGGEGKQTDFPEPNYTAKRPSPTQSTHLNPATHSRGARGKI